MASPEKEPAISELVPEAVTESASRVDQPAINPEIDEKQDSDNSHNVHDVKKNRASVLDGLKLPLPPAYDLSIQGLSIGVPPQERYLPLPVPIPYPAFLSKDKDLTYQEQTIIHDVDVRCGSGEVLAM